MKKIMKLISAQFKNSELLTEEVQESLKTELEIIINEKVVKIVKEKTDVIEESYNQKIQTITEEGQTKLDEYIESHSNKMNEYLSEGVTEFLDTNELAIDAGIKVERATNLIEGIKSLLKENDITILPEDEDIVKDLENSNIALKDTNERLISEKAEAIAQCFEYEKAVSFTKLTEALTEVQKAEVISMNRGIISNTIDDFERNVKIIVEKVQKVETNIIEDSNNIIDSLEHSNKRIGNGQVDQYL